MQGRNNPPNNIITQTLRKEICFEFIKSSRTRELNLLRESSISPIKSKKKQINILNKEIRFRRIEEQLKTPNLKNLIKNYEK